LPASDIIKTGGINLNMQQILDSGQWERPSC
jgi:hypothetical protein